MDRWASQQSMPTLCGKGSPFGPGTRGTFGWVWLFGEVFRTPQCMQAVKHPATRLAKRERVETQPGSHTPMRDFLA